jgi:putative FmdB family regulatory protein
MRESIAAEAAMLSRIPIENRPFGQIMSAWRACVVFSCGSLPMPIYEFRCQACGHRFERLQKMSDADPDTCPVCGEKQVGRMLSAPSFRLAGSGWYETDFKKEGDKKRNLADSGDGPKPVSDGAAPAAAATPAAAPAPAATPAPVKTASGD